MNYISNEDILKLGITSQEMLDWAGETIKHKKESVLPPKISMKQEGFIFYNVMSCILPALGIAGVKLVNRYPENEPSLKSNLMLYNLENGSLKAVMDADLITTWRTAAVAVHSIKLFAKSDASKIAFIGMGNVGKATLKVFVDTVDRNYTVRIFNYENCAQEIVDSYRDAKNIKWEIFDDYEEMVKDADVVVSAVTYADHDFADESCYKPGCLLVPIHTLGFQGCDLTFDKIFGDDTGHVCGFKYFDKFRSFNEVCDVVNGGCEGRTSGEERIIAYNIGIAIHDLTFADKIYRKINEVK